MAHTRVTEFEELEQVLLPLVQTLTSTAEEMLGKLNALEVATIIKGFAGKRPIDERYCDALLNYIANQCWKQFWIQLQAKPHQTVFLNYRAQRKEIEKFLKDVQGKIRRGAPGTPQQILLEGLIEHAASALNYFGIPQVTVATGQFFLRWSRDLLSLQSRDSLSQAERACLHSMNNVLMKDTGSDLVVRIASIVQTESQTPGWQKIGSAHLHAIQKVAKPPLETVFFYLSQAQFKYAGANPETCPLADGQAASSQVLGQCVSTSTHAATLVAMRSSDARAAAMAPAVSARSAAIDQSAPLPPDERVTALLLPGGPVLEGLEGADLDNEDLLKPAWV